ncbi:MAG: chromosome segregation protein SMC [Gammaproteobacteria bacterium]|nr:chromosome segregation protein SMC [Gammaproteobacteria bacterium]
MKILQLRFANLNSLTGEWQIDFTDPAFAAEGIFAITGPTGAGKSTILDAICLALYGRTPRLGKITKSSNEIMSRQSGECFAEVSFATSNGHYRCHWSQHRSRRKADGELQQPKQEIANADSGELLESKLREVEEAVIRITGMDFERFTRSVLLAQGGFAAFLQAAPDARAPILEQITGTDIYSRISVRVHELQREQREQLRLLEAQLAGIRLLSADEEQALSEALATDGAAEQQQAARHKQLEQALQALLELQRLQQDIDQLHEQLQQLEVQRTAFAPQRSRLALALQAAELEAPLAALNTLRSEQAANRKQLEQEQQAMPALISAVQQATAGAQTLDAQTQAARTALQQAAPVLQQVRALDLQLQQQTERLQELKQAADNEQQRAAGFRTEQGQQQQQLEQQLRQQQELADWLQQHAADQWLVSGLAGIEQQLAQLQQQQAQGAVLRQRQQHAHSALEQAQRQLEQQRQHWAHSQQQLQQGTARLESLQATLHSLLDGRQLRDYRSERDHLLDKRALLARIQSLEEQRSQLHSGLPCPLCGSCEHPYAQGQLPQLDSLGADIAAVEQRISQIEQQQEQCQQLEQANQQLQAAFAAMEVAGLAARAEVELKQQALDDIHLQQAGQLEQLQALHQQLGEQLQPLGVPLGEDISALLQQLRQRQSDWQSRQQLKQQLDSSQGSLQAEISRLQSLAELHQQQWQAGQVQLEQQHSLQQKSRQQRQQLYGDTQPDVEEQRLQQALEQAQQQQELQRQQLQQLEQQQATASDRIQQLEQRLHQQDAARVQQQTALQQALTGSGFADEAALAAALLPAVERQALHQQAQQLDEAHTRLTARLQDSQQRQQERQQQHTDGHTLEQLQADCEQSNSALQALRERLATLRYQLDENAKAKHSQQDRQQALLAQQQECKRWDELHALIGSADGKKFRNFAQGLTFELMVGHANRTLQQMSDRYLLVRDQSEPLELNVVDNYQAGEIRSTKNLSGGESFIVSLALALGLSRMASQNVRVDSLFLDEGFGTLDEEALDVALDTLSGLQQDGKLIGVISHVQALKERVATQIAVRPQNGGRSRLDGPGCSRKDA